MSKVIRRASGVIAYQFADEGQIEVVLVKKTNGRGWTFPKGGVELFQSDATNATKEAYEEAGIIGAIESKLGFYRYTKDDVKQHVVLFQMRIAMLLDDYPESEIRKRQVCLYDEAVELLDKDNRKLLDELIENLQQ
ncbi:hypothetical protein [Burkholderia phage BCSR5]|nr:hypothetical protein [Burkholderia phage BCSR5]